MLAILISIRSRHIANIFNGKKLRELRKKFPKHYRGWVYIYCCKDKLSLAEYLYKDGWGYDVVLNYDYAKSIGCAKEKLNGKVVARFYCDNVEEIKFHCLTKTNSYGVQRIETTFTTQTLSFTELKKLSCLTGDDLMKYLNDTDGYAINITKLEIFDEPKELSEFSHKDCKTCIANNGCNKVEKIRNNCLGIPLTKAPQSWQYVEVTL